MLVLFEDPLAVTVRDEKSADEERWLTLRTIGQGSLLIVAHTWVDLDNEEVNPDYLRARPHRTRKKDL